MAASLSRQNFHAECEAMINRQINMELTVSYVYMSMGFYFDRDDVALPGFAQYFHKAAEEERSHAEKFMKYQNTRGGRIVLEPIEKPERDEWGTGLDAMQMALVLEKRTNQALLDLGALAARHGDPQLCDFIATEYLQDQVNAIKEIACHITNLKRCGSGLGEYLYQREALES